MRNANPRSPPSHPDNESATGPGPSTLVTAPLLRITLEPSEENGLRKISQVMVERAITFQRDKAGWAFGRIDPNVLIEVEQRQHASWQRTIKEQRRAPAFHLKQVPSLQHRLADAEWLDAQRLEDVFQG